MQLNVTTEYAIRVVLYLGQCKKRASATEISNKMGIPKGYLEKVLLKLKKAEYISADLGANRNAVNYCAVRRYYEKVQKRLEQQFLSISLEKMLEQEEEK